MGRILILAVFLITSLASVSYGQCPVVNFSIKDTVCVDENLAIENNSSSIDSFSWDFCSGDLLNIPVSNLLTNISGIANARNLTVVNSSSGWYGFTMDITGNNLFRLSFGSDLSSVPISENMGNINNKFNRPIPIIFTKFNQNWYGFVFNGGAPDIVRLNFGSDLNNSPTTTDVIGSVGGDFTNMDIGVDSGNYILLLSNFGGNNFSIINLGNSPENIPSLSDALSTTAVSGANFIDIKLYKECTMWHAFTVGYSNKKIYRLDFNNGLAHLPEITELGGYGFGADNPTRISVAKESGKFVCFVVAESGNLYRLNIGSDILSNSLESFDSLGNSSSSNSFGFTLSRSFSNWYGFSLTANGSLYKIEFPDNCSANISTSTALQPSGISYSSAGTFYLAGYGYKSYGDYQVQYDTLVVRSIVSPKISFTTPNACFGISNTFNGSSPDSSSVTSWTWDFGDGSPPENGQSVNHQYSTANGYKVTLDIDAQNGCSNTLSDSIHIYTPPVPDFDYSPSIACERNNITFSGNSSSTAPDSITTFLWNFNNETTSNAKDTVYQFEMAGTKSITYTVSIPGCSFDTLKTLEVQASPVTAFTFQNQCNGIPIDFSNTTTGDFSQVSWEFGDGYTSTVTNPVHLYDTTGIYPVALTAVNSLGCAKTEYDTVSIYHYPVAGYEYDLPCTGTAVGFYDTSVVSEANIIKYNWNISSPALPGFTDTSSVENPTFIITKPGDYLVKLRSESNYGCADSVSKTISFLPGPEAGFGFNNACFGDSTYFINNSLAPDTLTITSYFWEIDSTISNLSDPAYLFKSPGNYNVTLSIRADNLCSGVTAKTVTINPSPVAGILAGNNCLNLTSVLKDDSSAPGDSIVSYDWQIGNSMSFTGPELSLRFDSAGIYEILHGVTTAAGCKDEITNSIQIYPVPEASFTMIPPKGSPPLDVSFENNSTGADTYYWNFGVNDSIASDESDPVYTYDDEGNFRITLTAGNQYGCIDSTFRNLSITTPVFDIKLKKVTAFENNGALRFILDIANNGTVIVDNLNVAIKINNEYSITEPFDHTFYAGDTASRLLNFQFLNTRSVKPDYICFTLEPVLEGQTEINTENNSACYTPENTFTLIEPYPNPVSRDLTVSFIMASQDNIKISLYSPGGSIITGRSLENGNPGYHEVHFDMGTYSSGLYILSITGNNVKMMRKIFVVR
jgi:PKD repeat protein